MACTIKRHCKNISFLHANTLALVFAINLQSNVSSLLFLPSRSNTNSSHLFFFSFRIADSYHTLYCLAGLSSAQHHIYPSATRRKQLQDAWAEEAQPGEVGLLPRLVGIVRSSLTSLLSLAIDLPVRDDEAFRKAVFTELLSWTEEEGVSNIVGGEANRLVCSFLLSIHPSPPLLSFIIP